MSSSICIPNMTLLACKVVEKSLTKSVTELRKGGRTGGRTDGMTDRCKPVYPGNTLEGDVSDVIALDQLTSPFSPRKATKMSP